MGGVRVLSVSSPVASSRENERGLPDLLELRLVRAGAEHPKIESNSQIWGEWGVTCGENGYIFEKPEHPRVEGEDGPAHGVGRPLARGVEPRAVRRFLEKEKVREEFWREIRERYKRDKREIREMYKRER